jgi:hypothetical protein
MASSYFHVAEVALKIAEPVRKLKIGKEKYKLS